MKVSGPEGISAFINRAKNWFLRHCARITIVAVLFLFIGIAAFFIFKESSTNSDKARLGKTPPASTKLSPAFDHSKVDEASKNSSNLPSNLSVLTERSAIIFTGKTEKVESFWNKEKTQIYSLVTFRVYEYLKGERKEKHITLKQLGGTVGDITMKVSDAPMYTVGEEVLLFVSGAGYIPVLEKVEGDFSPSSTKGVVSEVKKFVR
jgi:hypothetical protein